MDMHATMIGAPVSQIHGPDKVAGRTRFAADVDVPGMLWGKILRSPHPHARIRHIDAAVAWSVPSVKAVVTYTEGHAVMQACAQMRRAIQDGTTLPRTMTVAYAAPQPADIMYCSAQVTEVDVDRETGQVKVIKVVTAL